MQLLTLDEVMREQEDLASLCSDRTLSTHEICTANAFYGIDGVIKAYAGLPSWYVLKAVIPHGIHLTDHYVWQYETHSLVPMVLCYPPYRQEAYVAQTCKKVVLAASPYVYVAELMRCLPKPERQGTIFFPAHSTHWNTVHTDFHRLADELTQLDEEFKPVTICMYWRDYNLGRHLPFLERGLDVVSAGHMYDPQFLYRLYHLCSLHTYAASNDVGSHLFNSVHSGCRFFLFPPLYQYIEYDTAHGDGVIGPDPEILSDLRAQFTFPDIACQSEQEQCADYYLGVAHKLPPRQLRVLLMYAELIDKVSFPLQLSGRATTYMRSNYLTRLLKRHGNTYFLRALSILKDKLRRLAGYR